MTVLFDHRVAGGSSGGPKVNETLGPTGRQWALLMAGTCKTHSPCRLYLERAFGTSTEPQPVPLCLLESHVPNKTQSLHIYARCIVPSVCVTFPSTRTGDTTASRLTNQTHDAPPSLLLARCTVNRRLAQSLRAVTSRMGRSCTFERYNI